MIDGYLRVEALRRRYLDTVVATARSLSEIVALVTITTSRSPGSALGSFVFRGCRIHLMVRLPSTFLDD